MRLRPLQATQHGSKCATWRSTVSLSVAWEPTDLSGFVCTVGLVPGTARLTGIMTARITGRMGVRAAFTGEVGASRAGGATVACAAEQQSAQGDKGRMHGPPGTSLPRGASHGHWGWGRGRLFLLGGSQRLAWCPDRVWVLGVGSDR